MEASTNTWMTIKLCYEECLGNSRQATHDYLLDLFTFVNILPKKYFFHNGFSVSDFWGNLLSRFALMGEKIVKVRSFLGKNW